MVTILASNSILKFPQTYSLVGMSKDGKAKVLNDEFEIDQALGNSATREQIKIRENETATKDRKDLSVYTRKSNGASIGCECEKGQVNMFYYNKAMGENENVGIQVETSSIPSVNGNIREIMNRDKGQYHKDDVRDEIQKHLEEGCEPKDVKDFDGYEDTSSHIHQDMIENAVDTIYEYGEVSNLFNRDEVRSKLEREIKKIESNNKSEQNERG